MVSGTGLGNALQGRSEGLNALAKNAGVPRSASEAREMYPDAYTDEALMPPALRRQKREELARRLEICEDNLKAVQAERDRWQARAQDAEARLKYARKALDSPYGQGRS